MLSAGNAAAMRQQLLERDVRCGAPLQRPNALRCLGNEHVPAVDGRTVAAGSRLDANLLAPDVDRGACDHLDRSLGAIDFDDHCVAGILSYRPGNRCRGGKDWVCPAPRRSSANDFGWRRFVRPAPECRRHRREGASPAERSRDLCFCVAMQRASRDTLRGKFVLPVVARKLSTPPPLFGNLPRHETGEIRSEAFSERHRARRRGRRLRRGWSAGNSDRVAWHALQLTRVHICLSARHADRLFCPGAGQHLAGGDLAVSGVFRFLRILEAGQPADPGGVDHFQLRRRKRHCPRPCRSANRPRQIVPRCRSGWRLGAARLFQIYRLPDHDLQPGHGLEPRAAAHRSAARHIVLHLHPDRLPRGLSQGRGARIQPGALFAVRQLLPAPDRRAHPASQGDDSAVFRATDLQTERLLPVGRTRHVLDRPVQEGLAGRRHCADRRCRLRRSTSRGGLPLW